MLATTPSPPYYAVIFASIKSDEQSGYEKMSEDMFQLVHHQEGFLGLDTSRSDVGITVSYWKDEKAIAAWREHVEHKIARQLGRDQWYSYFTVRIAKVERDYYFSKVSGEER